jgi:predicted SAM-dependent methyltransferase
MKRLVAWVARLSDQWVAGFKIRHGLTRLASTPSTVLPSRTLLHVACGHATIRDIHLPGFHETTWREVRLDADPSVLPDIVGTMADMSAVPDGFADAIFSSHGIEHLYWHDVPRALTEFHRTLDSEGFLVITCPDVQAAARMIAEDRMFDTAYLSDAGPITPFDILYSYRPFVQANPQWMSHHCGFTLSTLTSVLKAAGFTSYFGIRRSTGFELWVLACKSKRSSEELSAMAARFLATPD